MPTCPSCGTENPAQARFCMSCATALVAPDTPAGETRKTVTVVFSDVVSSTVLGERLDPESLRRVMSRYFEAMRTALERHGGTVEKFIGDAVMAVFGIPTLHEDDALRAVRAAADMRGALAELNQELERTYGVTLQARTGVNTGEVVAGDPTRGQNLVTGDTVNTAARLEQAAGPGEILLGDPTHRLVRDAVVTEPTEPLTLKGKSEPLPAHRLIEVRDATPGHVRRLDSPMVGRDRQLAMLQQSFDAAVTDRACHLFTVLGPAGVGKSRLLEEFLSGHEPGSTVLRGRCLSYGEGISFWPLTEVIRQAAAIADDDPPHQATERIAALADPDQGPDVAERVAGLLGIADSSVPAEESFWAVRKVLESMARRDPLVLVFDDLHWAEPAFLDLVEHVVDFARDAPILLVCLARQELLDARPGWGGGKLNATSILLQPLTEGESRRLVENALGAADLAPEAEARIVAAAEGNPLFVEEMLSMLIDDGMLRRDDGHWAPTEDLSQVQIPPTITALITARLDQLGDEERAVTERASVVGRVFYRGAVAELAPAGVASAVGSHLMALVRKDLIEPHSSELGDQETFRFRHSLIRDAAYDTISKAVRADLHQRFAVWLQRAAGDRISQYEEILGYHLEQAVRYRQELGGSGADVTGLSARAATVLGAAGRRAFARDDMPAAANLLGRALALLPAGELERIELLSDLGIALSRLGDFPRAMALLSEARDEATAAGDQLLEATAVMAQLECKLSVEPEGVGEEILRQTERLIPILERHGDDRRLATAWYLVSWSHWLELQAGKRALALERALVFARRGGDRRQEADILYFLATFPLYAPTPIAEGLRWCQALRDRARGDRRVEASILWTEGGLLAMTGRFDEARRLVGGSVEMLRDMGMNVEAAVTEGEAGGLVELMAGDPGAAERITRVSLETLQGVGERSFLSTIATQLAEAVYRQGKYDEAYEATVLSEESAGSEDLASQIGWRSVRAKVLARRGLAEQAEAMAGESVAMAQRTDVINQRADALLALGEVSDLAGRADEATAAYREALALFEEKGAVTETARVRSLLEGLASRPDPGPL